jgi:hypothetical protein
MEQSGIYIDNEDSLSMSAKQRYEQCIEYREPYLKRAREAAELTLPYLMVAEDATIHSSLPTPFQGIGARGVNNLASKILMVALPPNAPFFRLAVNNFQIQQLAPEEEAMQSEIEKILGKLETVIVSEIEVSGDRVPLFEALKHLLITGNVLLNIDKDEGIRVFHLDRYVIKRDPMGKPLEILTKEDVSPILLPEEVREQILLNRDEKKDKDVEVFTWIKRDPDNGDQWTVHQEAEGIVLPGSEGEYPNELLPWLGLRNNRVDGSDYGRGFVEEYIGDLKSLEALTQALVEGSAAAAKVLFLVKPNGTTRVRTIAESPNGAIREGSVDDVGVLQLQKFNDFRVVQDQINKIESRLASNFLLNSSVQRQAERVTAEEIKYMAQELEEALGGFYSILSREFQLPYLRVRMAQLAKAGKVPQLPKNSIRPAIVTGLEALSRGHDRNKLVAFIGTLAQTFGAAQIEKYINVGDVIKRLATADAIDTEGLVKSEEQISQETQAQQQQGLMQQVAPNVAGEIGKGMNEQIKADREEARPAEG